MQLKSRLGTAVLIRPQRGDPHPGKGFHCERGDFPCALKLKDEGRLKRLVEQGDSCMRSVTGLPDKNTDATPVPGDVVKLYERMEQIRRQEEGE
jgi:hypothetical protein